MFSITLPWMENISKSQYSVRVTSSNINIQFSDLKTELFRDIRLNRRGK